MKADNDAAGLRVRPTNKWSFNSVCKRCRRAKSAILLGIITLCILFIQSRSQNGGSFRIESSSTSKDFPKWNPGKLDIHHLQVGSSVSSFVVMPDGTTMLIDAGDLSVPKTLEDWAAMGPPFDKLNLRTPYPNDSKTPAEWIIDYMKDFWPYQAHPELKLDYVLVTHLHADHVGDGSPQQTDRQKSPSGNYVLSGISELASKFGTDTIIDRGYPNEGSNPQAHHDPMEEATLENYVQFKEENKNSIHFETFEVGSTQQITMKMSPTNYDFQIQVLKCNLDVILPYDPLDPKNDTIAIKKIEGEISAENAHGNENTMSAAITIQYGDFRYYEGADQEVVRNKDDDDIILDTIGPTAKAAGKVDVATLNHHGHGMSSDYIEYIDPPIMILQGWSSDQPPQKSMEMLEAAPYKDGQQRKIFATDIFKELLDGMGPTLSSLFQSTSGHVVVRVHPPPPKQLSDRQTFEIVVLDGNRKIRAYHGQFPVRAGR